MSSLLTGAFSAFGVGFLSLSRVSFLPTYMLFGLATSYFNMIEGKRSRRGETVDQRVILRYIGISTLALITLDLFLRIAP